MGQTSEKHLRICLLSVAPRCSYQESTYVGRGDALIRVFHVVQPPASQRSKEAQAKWIRPRHWADLRDNGYYRGVGKRHMTRWPMKIYNIKWPQAQINLATPQSGKEGRRALASDERLGCVQSYTGQLYTMVHLYTRHFLDFHHYSGQSICSIMDTYIVPHGPTSDFKDFEVGSSVVPRLLIFPHTPQNSISPSSLQ